MPLQSQSSVTFTSLTFRSENRCNELYSLSCSFCYRILAFLACCLPCRIGGVCEGIGSSRPPPPVLVVYLCTETPVSGKSERLGNVLSHGYRPPDTSELETNGLEQKQIGKYSEYSFVLRFWLYVIEINIIPVFICCNVCAR